MEAETRIIKKYPNRRLYDTSLCAYINLIDIKQLVLDHENFIVIDAKTKKDITQSTLLQIIAEEEMICPIFSTTLLQGFIRLYNEKSQILLSEYLEQAMNLFIKQKEYFKQQMTSYEAPFSGPNFFEEMFNLQKQWLNLGFKAKHDKK
jgi:polyhydroxyalkanoate synthesis repressor PhaR